MMKLKHAALTAALILGSTAAGAASLTGAPPAPDGGTTPILVAAKRLGVIPANCTMDPWKKVYVCCTQDSSGTPQCTEHPLDTDWPVKQRLLKVRPLQTQPLTLQPSQ